MELLKTKILRINSEYSSVQDNSFYTVCMIQNNTVDFEINEKLYQNISNSIFFITPTFKWKIIPKDTFKASGYILFLPKQILNHPTFKNLDINHVRLSSTEKIPKFKIAPGIEKRMESILQMLDEFLSTELKHKEEAILSLLKTFFVYCDGKCNIKSVISDSCAKSSVVYNFKKLIDKHITHYHKVTDYANILNISVKYLNECVQDTLHVNAKNLITEQLLMQSRFKLKFTDKSVKEIGYELGFTSSDYFSYFIKKHVGKSPKQLQAS